MRHLAEPSELSHYTEELAAYNFSGSCVWNWTYETDLVIAVALVRANLPVARWLLIPINTRCNSQGHSNST
jgi:hypothetical protein